MEAPPLEDEYDSDYGSHHDVSRTVSDQSEESDVERLRLEFARKLGYSEGQVQTALSKLGPRPSQNELLAELIQLDNKGPPSVEEPESPHNLRHIIIDGSNVAMSHGQNRVFSCRGIQLAVEWFKSRGHGEITVFVPSFRKGGGEEIRDPQILTSLESAGHLVFTPSRKLSRRLLTCYDDRYILKLALETEGVILSNDSYRDLQVESEEYKRLVEERVLMYTFVGDRFMPPDDPLGRNGPSLSSFLSKSSTKGGPPCPYGRKCTYGNKCKYYHEKLKPSVSEVLRKQAASCTQSLPLTSGGEKCILTRVKSAGEVATHRKLRREYSVVEGNELSPFPNQPHLARVWSPPERGTDDVYNQLAAIFPPEQVRHVMGIYREERDPGVLCRHIVRLFS